jgi:proton-dependent oligopeptide transporter, POT family
MDEAIGGAEFKASAADERKHSLAIARGDASVEGDVALVGEPFPTEEEYATLRRVSHKIPLSILTIAFIEMCERFSYYGSIVVCKCNPC